jgi:signal transduction histidine kinase
LEPHEERRRRITHLFGDEPANVNVAALEAILDSLDALVWAVGPDNQICYGNRRWWMYSGLAASERSAQVCLRVFHPDERAVATACWLAAVERGEAGEMRHRLRRASDHGYRWHLCRMLPVAGAAGRWAGSIMVATDVHDLTMLAIGEGASSGVDVNVLRVRALLQDAPVPLALYEGPWHRCVFANDAARQAVDAVGGDRAGSFPQLDVQVRGLFDDVYARGQPLVVKELAVRGPAPGDPDRERLFDFVLAPTRDATGKVFGVVGAGNDVTEPVRARQALEQTAERLARLEAMAAALADVLDPHRAAQIVADQTCAAAGALRCAVSVHGQPATMVAASGATADAETAPVTLPLGAPTAPIGTLQLTFPRPRALEAGEHRYLESLARHGGLAIERACLYQQAERARREATVERERLLMVIREAPVPMAMFRGPEGALELANARWEALFPPGEIPPAPPSARIQAAIAGALCTGGPQILTEIEVPLAQRRAAHYTLTLQPLREADGCVGGVIVVAVEVTDHVHARRTLHDELAARDASGRREADLLAVERATRSRVEQDSRAKDEFLALLGHELRNPLAPIVVALQLLRMRGAAAQVRELGIIERQVQHLVRLVDDLLDVSRITRGLVRLRKERIELAAVVSAAVEMASPLLEQREQHLTVDVATDCPVDADRDRLAQVIANLLTNAAKYTAPRGQIHLRAASEGGAVVLRVQDNGRGIAPELLAVVFDMFVQGNRPIDRSEGGLGLGLTLVRTLVELHGGTVTAHSGGPGQGSEFVIRLPLAAAPTPLVTADSATPSSRTGRRVLIVDDNPDVVEVLAELLRMSGHEVAVAHDAPEALRLAGPFQPEVAVLDIGLPVMDGYELARRLRLGDPALRLVALTGYGQAEDRARSRAAGFQEHLVKPIDGDVLLAVVAAKPL